MGGIAEGEEADGGQCSGERFDVGWRCDVEEGEGSEVRQCAGELRKLEARNGQGCEGGTGCRARYQ